MKDLIRKILRESDEWDFVRDTQPLGLPITEDIIHYLIGYNFTYNPRSRSHYHSKYEIIDVSDGEVTFITLHGHYRINHQPIERFLKFINNPNANLNNSWPLIDPSTDEVHTYYQF